MNRGRFELWPGQSATARESYNRNLPGNLAFTSGVQPSRIGNYIFTRQDACATPVAHAQSQHNENGGGHLVIPQRKIRWRR
jgi:hypothetical protein